MSRPWTILCSLLLSTGASAGGSSLAQWFEQPAIAHLVLAADGEKAAWLDLRDDAVSLRRGSIDDLSNGAVLTRLRERTGLGLYQIASYYLIHSALASGDEQLTLIDGRDGSITADFRVAAPASFSILGQQRSPRSILVTHDARQYGAPDIFRLRPGSTRLELIEQNPGRIFSWLADEDGEVLLARRWRPAGNGIAYQLLYRQHSGGPWRQIAEHDLQQAPIVPRGFAPGGGSVYVTTEGASGEAELRQLEALNGRLGPALVVLPHAGIQTLSHDPTTGALALIGYEQSLPGFKIMNQTWSPSMQLLGERLPGSRYRFLGVRQQKDSVWHVYGAEQPGGYFLLDKTKLSLQQLGRSYPNLAGRRLAPVKPFEFEAADGLHLSGYLTVSDNASAPPAIVLVHGGPWTRDYWAFNPEVQYLATLGYAVVQINYRGSRGLGNALLQSGRRQWGQGMQTDLVAGVAELATRGLINPERVCIMGSSYGGYAALMGVVEFPEVFRCAVARSAVVDLRQQIVALQRSGNQRAYLEWNVMVGDLGGSPDRLNTRSPLHRWMDLKRPVLLAHGRLDPAVEFAPVQRLADQLAEHQADIRWLPFDAEGHGLSNNRNRQVFYSAVAEFLGRNLR